MKEEKIEYITEEGTVESIDAARGIVTVRLNDNRECGGCPAHKLCSLGSDSSTSTIDVYSRNAAQYRTGDKVTLRGTEQLHRKAIMLATVLPCIILVAIMVLIFLLTGNQLAAATGGLGSMIFFFVLLYLLRNKIAHEFKFTIDN